LVILRQLNHPSPVEGSLHLGEIVNQFVGGNAGIIGEGRYRCTYRRVNGGSYILAGSDEGTSPVPSPINLENGCRGV
jgi:hypothetical protein